MRGKYAIMSGPIQGICMSNSSATKVRHSYHYQAIGPLPLWLKPFTYLSVRPILYQHPMLYHTSWTRQASQCDSL